MSDWIATSVMIGRAYTWLNSRKTQGSISPILVTVKQYY